MRAFKAANGTPRLCALRALAFLAVLAPSTALAEGTQGPPVRPPFGVQPPPKNPVVLPQPSTKAPIPITNHAVTSQEHTATISTFESHTTSPTNANKTQTVPRVITVANTNKSTPTSLARTSDSKAQSQPGVSLGGRIWGKIIGRSVDETIEERAASHAADKMGKTPVFSEKEPLIRDANGVIIGYRVFTLTPQGHKNFTVVIRNGQPVGMVPVR